MGLSLTLKPTDRAVQFIKFFRVFGGGFGIILFQNLQLDQQKKNAVAGKLFILRLMESAFGFTAVDFYPS